jgi:hypothetical protein
MPTEIKTCFNGCSFTYGEGFDLTDRDLYVYDRILAKKYNWASDNIAVPGSDNHNIFLRSAESIQSQKYNIVFTQWSALNRFWLSPGPETYYFINDVQYSDYTYRDLYINPSDKKKLNELLLLLNHDYQNIINLTNYCNILEQLAQANNTRVVFINGLIPWQEDLIQTLGSDIELGLSPYSKSILDFNTRRDDEIIKYFLKLQQKISTLNKNSWVNMFNSFQTNICDHAPAGHHPGVKSHKWMADKITHYIDHALQIA